MSKLALALLMGLSQAVWAQDLGPCPITDGARPPVGLTEPPPAVSPPVTPPPPPSATCPPSMPLPGSKAPNFTLKGVVGQEIVWVKLSESYGQWRILLFYPADFTSVPPTELGALADRKRDLDRLGATVIAISTDSIYCHWMFKEGSPSVKRTSFPLVSDPLGEVAKAYGVYAANQGVALNSTFIVSPTGIIMGAQVLRDDVGISVNELIRQIEALRAIARSPGMAAPAGWTTKDRLISNRIPECIGRR